MLTIKKPPFAFRSIVFLQDHEAEEPLEILENDGEKALADYLMQWDYGEGETTGNPPWGTSDTVRKIGGYFLTYSIPFGYVGLVSPVTRSQAEQWGELERLQSEKERERRLS